MTLKTPPSLNFMATITVIGSLLGTGIAIAQSPQASPIFESINLSPQFEPDPQTIRGISGGEVAARTLAEQAETPTGPCVGFIDQQPDHTLILDDFFEYLSVQVLSPADTTLVIRGPGGTWCNDDGSGRSGKNPAIAGQWLEGQYEIWIGSYEQNTYHPYVIKMTQIQ